MTILARRRLQAMLDDVAPMLEAGKGKDVLRRLNHPKNVEQALPAEMELALIWAASRLGDLNVEPDWWGDEKRPDVVTDNIVPGRQTAIEIAATSDNTLSGEEDMDAIAQQIILLANRTERGSGHFLYFTFGEESGFEQGRPFRRRLAPKGYRLPERLQQGLADWLPRSASQQPRIRLLDQGLDVTIERMSYRQTRYHNVHTSMPPETRSLEDNPLFGLLRRKKRQLKAAAAGTLRMIFIADIGSTLLQRIAGGSERHASPGTFSGSQIIGHFMARYSGQVDAVVVFSPFKESAGFGDTDIIGRKRRRWNVSFFGTPAMAEPPAALEEIAGMLPAPNYMGYQARSLFRQGSFSTGSRGQHLGMTITSTVGKGEHRIEFPARMLLDLLAGRLTEAQFRQRLAPNGARNIFANWLDQGLTISGAEMAPRQIDDDDDHLILHFSDDPAARPFKLPD